MLFQRIDVPVPQDFRHIAEKHDISRADRLFRAAISAFCALTRPSRREIIQLEELCLQLYEGVSEESLRYVSAALSDCPLAPAALVRRLADERIEVAAPLLLKSTALTEIDLIAIVGHHGASHARVVAQRRSLTTAIAGLLQKQRVPFAAPVTPTPDAAETTRQTLRSMMQPSRPAVEASDAEADPDTGEIYQKLRATALSGSLHFFETALADALRIEYNQAHDLVSAPDKRDLSRALKALELSAEQAFLLVSATFPSGFGHPSAIRDFLERFEMITNEEAITALRLYQADAVFTGLARKLAGNANQAPKLPRRTHAA